MDIYKLIDLYYSKREINTKYNYEGKFLCIKKKIMSTFIVGALAIVPMVAFAASYNVSYTFKYQVNGKNNNQTYSMNAGSIKVTVESTTDYLKGQPQTYDQTLMRVGTFYDTTIGTVQPIINGYSSNTWTNMNSGTYYLINTKRDDGAYTTATGTISN